MTKITRAEIMAILDANAPRLAKKTKELITWEIYVTLNQQKLWQDEPEDGAENPAVNSHQNKK